MRKLIGAIDQSTTSTKFSVFDQLGTRIAYSEKPHEQITPQEGWLEHNPREIFQNLLLVMDQVKNELKGEIITTIGITNQRETTIAWNKHNGKPYYNAIVWSDNRCQQQVNLLAKQKGNYNYYKNINGLIISSYFSAFKMQWLIDNVDEIKQDFDNVLFGTIDSYLVYMLTGNHFTDVTNCSRTFLMNLYSLKYEQSLIQQFQLKESQLPKIKSSADDYGVIQIGPFKDNSISAVIGDQQAASVGHSLFQKGDVKTTYGNIYC